jgi:dipeptidyl aminopeptidase/acylaminoacyl peptidase
MSAAPIARREFLRRAAALGFVLPFAGLSYAGAADAALVARRVYFDNPGYQNVRISPDGAHLAYVAPRDGVRNLWVAPVADPQSARPLTQATDRDIGSYFSWAFTSRHIVFFREHDGDENWRASSVDIDSGETVLLTPERAVRSFLQELDPRFPEEALLRHNERDKRFFDLYRINLVTGKEDRVYENRDYVGLVTDSHFRLRLGIRYAADGSAEVFERTTDGNWVLFTTLPIGDLDGTKFLDFSDDGNMLYLLDSRGRDKAVFIAFDMTTRRGKVLAEDIEADIVNVAFCDRVPLAARSVKDRARWHPVDPDTAKDLGLLAMYGPGDVEFLSHTLGNRKASVYFERDTASGEYVLLDREAGVVRPLYVQRKSLAGVRLRPLEPVVIPARDGLALNGYLTLPEGGSSSLPLVLLIHGGPYWRDEWGFNATHQWLAGRGYAVLSVNYRGSTGFGKAFVTAADHEWGARMHDDLIDAVDWAVAKGIADRQRVGLSAGATAAIRP